MDSEPIKCVEDALIAINKIRESAKEMMECKLARKDISGFKNQGITAVLKLKRLNRAVYTSLEKLKTKVRESKLREEKHNLSLQSLLYQKSHIQREMHVHQDYQTTEFNKIDLIAEIEFKEVSDPSKHDGLDDHSITVNRIHHEREMREVLAVEKQELAAEKKELIVQVKKANEDLIVLPGYLNKISEAAAPVRSYFNLPFTLPILKEIYSLPTPLYTLYRQLDGFKGSFADGSYTLVIVATPNLIPVSRTTTAKDNSGTTSKTAKRRKIEPTTNSTKDVSMEETNNDNEDDTVKIITRSEAFTVHEQTLVLTMSIQSLPQLKLRFLFYPHLNVVSVDVVGGKLTTDNLLISLYSDDTGASLPNVSSQHVIIEGVNDVKPKQAVTWPREVLDRPYQWLQRICGLYNLPNRKGSMSPIEPCTRSSLIKILNRYKSLMSVEDICSKLPAKITVDNDVMRQMFPSTPLQSSIVLWREKTSKGGDVVVTTSRTVVESGEIVMEGDDDSTTEQTTQGSGRVVDIDTIAQSDTDTVTVNPSRTYVMKIERGNFTIDGEVMIKPTYPISPSLFRFLGIQKNKSDVTSDYTVALKEIESEVNDYYQELLGGKAGIKNKNNLVKKNKLLGHQLHRVLMCVDILTDRKKEAGEEQEQYQFVYNKHHNKFESRI